MALRVIAGSARGVKLQPVPGDKTRPIMDRVKEALFSIIGVDIQGCSFLDLFAGTGSVGIEALSRGADYALFIDSQRGAIKTIHGNLGRARLADSADVRRRDAFELLNRPPKRAFDFIFIAPPQYQGIWWRALRALDRNADWRLPGLRIIAQIDPRELDDGGELRRLQLMDQRRYGRTMLLFYEFGDLDHRPE